MPSGIRIPLEEKKKALIDYYAGKSVNEICYRYGIKRRAIYDWAKLYGHGKRSFNPRDPRRGMHINLAETELILLMICECDKIIKGADRVTMRNLEERLLLISDELYELQDSKRRA